MTTDQGITLLLVDDEQRNLDALEAILDGQGYRLLRTDDAEKALRLLLENDVAAIILDIKMPGVSGFELAKLIKGTKKFREIPILFLTAYLVEDDDILAGYGAGAVDYLTKPIKAPVLRHKIAVFADLFRKTRALANLNDTLEQRVHERTVELEKSEAALRIASEQKDAFLATLAHELRNPLAPLRTGVDLLRQSPELGPAATRTLDAMNRQVAHMVRLIDDLLDISRITRGMLELKRERANIATIIDAAAEIAKPFLDQRQQTLRISSPGAIHVIADPTRLSQIVGNLLHNASKYAPAHSEIRVAVTSEADHAIIKVIDPGVGIPPEQLGRVFEMFAKIERKSPNANNGLGIGLALARQLAMLHGGTLTASSAGDGHGSTFTLALPSQADATVPAPAAAVARSGGTLTQLDVLVIEDNLDAGDMLGLWLENIGHKVRIARSGIEGLALIRESRPDIVLCDLGLPGMDGIEVCRNVLALGDKKPPLMVALTGWGAGSDRRRTREAGFDHHLVKPVALDRLREILATVML